MKAISVFEYDAIREPLSGGEVGVLDDLRGPRNEKMFDVSLKEARARSFVGVVQLGTRVLQVLPKMYKDELPPSEREREATSNLLFLLSYTRKLDVQETQIASLLRQEAPISEFLYWIFARRLWDAVRREMLRGYVTLEDRLDVLKGRWLVTTQSRRPDGWRRDRFDVAYDEFTEDNLPNQLFAATVLRLSRWAAWPETRSRLAQLRTVFSDVTHISPQREEFSKAMQWMQRYRRRAGEGQTYRPLLKMAEMFWMNAGPQLSPGRNETFAFMFNMNELFEEFIAEFICRELREAWESCGWSFYSQSGARSLLRDDSNRRCYWLKPDLRFETDDDKCPLILDTKYKRLKTNGSKIALVEVDESQNSVAEADVYQMFAYKERYRSPRVVLLYPQTSEKISWNFKTDADSTPWLEVRTVNLKTNLNKKTEQERLRDELAAILFSKQVEI